MNVARFNFSHGNHADHLERLNRLKAIRDAMRLSGFKIEDIETDSKA